MESMATHRHLADHCKSIRSQYKTGDKVLFVQIPQFIFKSFNKSIVKNKGYYVFPPTGLQYLYESLKTRALDIRILDLNFMVLKNTFEDKDFDHADWLKIIEDYLRDFNPNIVGVSCMYDSGIPSMIQLLELLKDKNESIVIAGGVIPTYEWKNLLQRGLCHFVIKKEGENRINYLFDKLMDEDRRFKPVSGICYRYRDDYIETEAAGEDKVGLDTNLIDSYSLVDIKGYCKYGSLNPFSRIAGINDSVFAAIQMNRGCRGSCSFCSVRDFIGSGIRKRPVKKVIEEMEFLINRCEVRHFEWLDDDLLFFKDDFKILLKEIIKRGWPVTWSANNGLIASSIDDELMGLMEDSGCIGFKIGVETGNPEMLKKIKKPATLNSFRKASAIFERHPKVFVGGNFMLGLPGEKFSQMMDSFKFLLELNLDWGAFTVCQAIRGATAFNDFRDYFETQLDASENIKNFIPTRESSKGELLTTESILKGLDIFRIDPNAIPGEGQIKEIWFAFNLVGNFINNKNLKPGGRVEKFIAWVEMAQVAYPANPYMSLFLALAYVIKGNQCRAGDYYNKAAFCGKEEYWKARFIQFGLDKLLSNFPKNAGEVFTALKDLKDFLKQDLLICEIN